MLRPEHAGSRRNTLQHDDGHAAPATLGSRSPHPYRRRSLDIPDNKLFVTNLAARDRQPLGVQQRNHRKIARNDSEGTDYFSLSRERDSRRTLATSPSESGTEADDEKPYLKGLPVATSRARKGLKGRSGTTSPSDFDSLRERLGRKSSGLGSRDGITAVGGHVEDYVRKWRAELVRRILEVAFVCGLGYWCVEQADQSTAKWEYAADTIGFDHKRSLRNAKRYNLGLLMLLLLRMGRVLGKHIRACRPYYSTNHTSVPTPPDPAPFLYPTVINLAVASSLEASTLYPPILAANMLLSNGPVMFLLGSRVPSDFRWLAGLIIVCPTRADLAMSLKNLVALSSHDDSPERIKTTRDAVSLCEDLTLLYPLHCALVPTIQYFCSSSLLRAETELLSIALLNLLFFAASPQSIILYALLWIGGVTLLISCRHVMKWSTMLARIPGWRFRAPRHAQAAARQDSTSLSAIGTLLNTSSLLARQSKHDSSDDGDWVINDFTEVRPNGIIGGNPRRSADRNEAVPLSSVQAIAKANTDDRPGQRARSNTLPEMGSPGIQNTAAAERQHRGRDRKTKSRPFLWLTRRQAMVVKWLLAAFVYAVTALTIFLPVRSYIQARALNDHEPVGWALGYLFGDINSFRLHVLLSDLDHWIPLPSRIPSSAAYSSSPRFLHTHVLGTANTRLFISAWCLLNLAVGISLVFHLRTHADVDTRRKVFHGMMVTMFLPTIPMDPCFVALAMTLVLAIFLLLDLFRAAQLPPVSRPLTHFLAPYVDGRDHKGPVVISPMFLLIGCAIPLWLSLAAAPREESGPGGNDGPWAGWEVLNVSLDMVSGVVCVGMGDAAASLVGRRYGRRRWPWSGGKSLEGSGAFVLTVTVGLVASKAWLEYGGWGDVVIEGVDDTATQVHRLTGQIWPVVVGKALLAGAGASFMEAVLTGGNDNVIVPVILWLLVRCLKI